VGDQTQQQGQPGIHVQIVPVWVTPTDVTDGG
jgi:hypothetical protein